MKSILSTSILSSAIALTFATAAVAAPRSPSSTSAKPATASASSPRPEGGLTILFDQTASPGTSGVLAMKNLDAGSEDYDADMADDFAVPAGGWGISQVRVGAFYQSGPTPVAPSTAGNVVFYADAAGAPGAAVPGCTYSDIPLSHDGSTGFSTLNLPTECLLPTAGTYWVSFAGNLSFNAEFGSVYVLQQTTAAGLAPRWRNPGDGFNSGCTAWTALPACGLTNGGGMTIQLLGRTTPVTLQAFGID